MQDNENLFPHNLYLARLTAINGISFTQREMDVLACLLQVRSTSKIAVLLNVASSTVITHVRNLMEKTTCNSREGIIDFIERSPKLATIKKYYISLLRYTAFEKSLREIAKLKPKASLTHLNIHVDNPSQRQTLFLHLENHLKQAGLHAEVQEGKANNTLCLYLSKEDQKKGSGIGESSELIDLNPYPVYYFCVFEILQILLPSLNLKPLIAEFTRLYENNEEEATSSFLEGGFSTNNDEIAHLGKKVRYILSCFCAVGLVGSFSVILLEKESNQREVSSLRSELSVPSASIFLNRSELISLINDKFNAQKQEGIQTVALVGIGGSGKTTLARQYAKFHKETPVWQINAETEGSLHHSFEQLANTLAQTEEDQKKIKSLLEIEQPKNRAEKILGFVKEKLREHPNWLLIYDNVEKFSTIQPFFPQDSLLWGKGKVLLTTQDLNIQNNALATHTVNVGELTSSQKLRLFLNIMTNGNSNLFTPSQKEEARLFLQKIPPFPLDVSTAAYYLRATEVPYEKYIKYLGKGNGEFENVRKTVMKEAGEYAKTRYQIIVLSLERLLKSHKDFADLLLFICLLDSQHIPVPLLELFKNDIIVSDFIYHLKKYSLLMHQDHKTSSFHPEIGLHRSTQEIGLSYLTKALGLENNQHALQQIAAALEKYSAEIIDKEDIPRMNALIAHCERFLQNTLSLEAQAKILLKGELGGLYFYKGEYAKAKQILEESLVSFKKTFSEHDLRLTPILLYLSRVHRQFTDYCKAQELLNQCLFVYQKEIPHHYVKIASLLTELGRLEGELGHYEKSRDTLEKSLLIYQEHCPQSFLKQADLLISLGNLYRELGHYKRAREVLKESLRLSAKYAPELLLKKMGALARLGNVYRSLGQYTRAKELLEQSMALYKTYYPQNHISLAWISTHLGNIYQKLGQYEKAKAHLERSYSLYQSYFHENHVAHAWVLIHLGNTYKALRERRKAKEYLEKGYRIYKAYNHGIAWSSAHLGNFYREQGQFDKAHLLLEKSLRAYQERTSQHDIRQALVLRYLGNLHRDLGDYQKAKEFLTASQAVYEKAQGNASIETARVLQDLSAVFLREDNKKRAKALLLQALKIFQRTSHPEAFLISKELETIRF